MSESLDSWTPIVPTVSFGPASCLADGVNVLHACQLLSPQLRVPIPSGVGGLCRVSQHPSPAVGPEKISEKAPSPVVNAETCHFPSPSCSRHPIYVDSVLQAILQRIHPKQFGICCTYVLRLIQHAAASAPDCNKPIPTSHLSAIQTNVFGFLTAPVSCP